MTNPWSAPTAEVPSLLDRLCLTIEPRSTQDALLEDITHILNTRRIPTPHPTRQPQSNALLSRFGMPDVTGLSLYEPNEVESLRREIETTIAAADPRLRAVNVRFERTHAATNRVISFVVEADFDAGPGREAIAFQTTLEGEALEFRIREAGERRRAQHRERREP